MRTQWMKKRPRTPAAPVEVAPAPAPVQEPPTPATAPVRAPIVIPVQDEQMTNTAARKKAAVRSQRGGVASTALSDTLGA